MDRAGLDPRYNPEYQRGFDPAVHGSRDSRRPGQVRTLRVPDVPQSPPSMSAGPGAAQSDLPHSAGETGEVGAVQGAGEDRAVEASAVDAVAMPLRGPVATWRNPYLIALTIVGIALLVGGVSAHRWAIRVSFGTFGEQFAGVEGLDIQELLVISQTAMGLAPMAVLAGLLTLLGVGFVFASSWRPKRPRSVEEPSEIADLFPSSSS